MTTAEAWREYERANARARRAYAGTYSIRAKCERCGQPHDENATTCRPCAIKHAERMRARRASEKEKS